jgi:hypothetical protein
MKTTNKLLAIIALIAVIGFAFIACDDGNGDKDKDQDKDKTTAPYLQENLQAKTVGLAMPYFLPTMFRQAVPCLVQLIQCPQLKKNLSEKLKTETVSLI